jgi:hypothetical protein
MNARQKEVLEQSLKDEQAVLDALTKNYTSALADIRKNIRELQANPLTQSKAYQLEYQKQLEKQISGVLDNLQGKNFNSIASYLQTCYETGFVGNMYDMQGQGVPLVISIDEGQVLKAVQKTGDDFRLSNKLSGNATELKKQVKSELQRGLASQLSYADIARNISNYGQADMNRSMRIARTEGHRVQSEARLDSMQKAKKLGADVVKQWDCTLDGKTRPEHSQLDGQIRELDEMFETSGYSGSAPGQFGDPYMDCNCRCCLLQRARWAVKGETSYQKWNNETGGFIECTGYEDFKQKYLKASEKLKTSQTSGIISISDCKDFDSLSAYVQKIYGFDIDDSVKILDYATVQQSMIGIEKVINEFPQAKQTLTGIGTSKIGVMCAGYNGKINFNPAYYADGKPSVAACMVQGETTGFHPKNTGVLETGSHEMGHLLERTLIEKSVNDGKYPFGAFAWNDSTESKAIISQACKTVKKTPEGKGFRNAQLKSQVSGYATKNDSECLAECVADYVANGDGASILSKEVWKMLKERLG